jgi:hypothetical protein
VLRNAGGGEVDLEAVLDGLTRLAPLSHGAKHVVK